MPVLPPQSRTTAPPWWRDRAVGWLVLGALLLQGLALSRVDGYQLADSVEFMERARTFVRGEELIDAAHIRPFGFSFLLLPFFAAWEWLGIEDARGLLPTIVALQMALGLVLVVVCARVGWHLGGRTTGLLAGAIAAMNPVLLQYSTQPVSGLAAGACVGLSACALLRREDPRPFRAGLWLAAAFVMAYQTLLVVFALAFALLVLGGWRRWRELRLVALGVGLGLLAQSCIDWLMYDDFGGSLVNYLAANIGSTLVSNLYRLYLWIGWEPLKTLAAHIYDLEQQILGRDEWTTPSAPEARALMSPWYYAVELPRMLAWPIIAGLALALPRAAKERSRFAGALLVAFLLNAYVMSHKGSKDFRLWLPLLPFIAPLAAFGLEFVAAPLAARPARAALRAAFVAGSLLLSTRELLAMNLAKYSGYARAIEWLDDWSARRGAGLESRHHPGGLPGKLAVASAYNWAVYLRHSPRLELVKLPAQLNMWRQHKAREDGRVREHEEILATLDDLDALILHPAILQQDPDLAARVALQFDVVAAFWDQPRYRDLGAVLVLARRDVRPAARILERTPAAAAAARLSSLALRGDALDFVSTDGSERLRFHGFELHALEPGGLWWITYHWTPLTRLSRDWTIVDRLSDPDQLAGWQNNHKLGANALDCASLAPGELVSEGFLLAPGQEPYAADGVLRPIGGIWRRGSLLPLDLWLGVRELAPADETGAARVLDRLQAAPLDGAAFVEPAAGERVDELGRRWSDDRLVRAGGLLLPTRADVRIDARRQWELRLVPGTP
jgi:hypothetical protein